MHNILSYFFFDLINFKKAKMINFKSKNINRLINVVKEIMDNPIETAFSISKKTGLKRNTVQNIMNKLKKKKNNLTFRFLRLRHPLLIFPL
jgi:hypothetical protein